jgi:hypothetical protein
VVPSPIGVASLHGSPSGDGASSSTRRTKLLPAAPPYVATRMMYVSPSTTLKEISPSRRTPWSAAPHWLLSSSQAISMGARRQSPVYADTTVSVPRSTP